MSIPLPLRSYVSRTFGDLEGYATTAFLLLNRQREHQEDDP
jgi:hypothetical protein